MEDAEVGDDDDGVGSGVDQCRWGDWGWCRGRRTIVECDDVENEFNVDGDGLCAG